MKILLNGATGGTNFGDFLFAKIFHETVSGMVGEENVVWHNSRYCLSDYYQRHLNYYPRKYSLKDIDMLVCISGGYFCGGDKTAWQYITRYFRYFHLCIRCILRKIPIAIIGVDVARSKAKLMDWIQKFILCRADVVVVRNQESYEQLKRYGVTEPVCTADTAHVIKPAAFEDCSVREDVARLEGKKIFFHVQASGRDVAKQLIPTVDRFVAKHPEYSVVIGLDQYCSNDAFLNELAGDFSAAKVVINHYDNPMELCKVLSMMDLIVTPKLHVGIVGASLSKSVVSFSMHTEKITRFYRQIEEDGRTMSMRDFSDDAALNMLEKYHDVPIRVHEDIIRAAESNLEYLKEFIQRHSH